MTPEFSVNDDIHEVQPVNETPCQNDIPPCEELNESSNFLGFDGCANETLLLTRRVLEQIRKSLETIPQLYSPSNISLDSVDSSSTSSIPEEFPAEVPVVSDTSSFLSPSISSQSPSSSHILSSPLSTLNSNLSHLSSSIITSPVTPPQLHQVIIPLPIPVTRSGFLSSPSFSETPFISYTPITITNTHNTPQPLHSCIIKSFQNIPIPHLPFPTSPSDTSFIQSPSSSPLHAFTSPVHNAIPDMIPPQQSQLNIPSSLDTSSQHLLFPPDINNHDRVSTPIQSHPVPDLDVQPRLSDINLDTLNQISPHYSELPMLQSGREPKPKSTKHVHWAHDESGGENTIIPQISYDYTSETDSDTESDSQSTLSSPCYTNSSDYTIATRTRQAGQSLMPNLKWVQDNPIEYKTRKK